MTWTAYSAGAGVIVTPPLLGSDGNLWAAFVPGSGVQLGAIIMTPAGSASYRIATVANNVDVLSNLVEKSANIYVATEDNYPNVISWQWPVSAGGPTGYLLAHNTGVGPYGLASTPAAAVTTGNFPPAGDVGELVQYTLPGTLLNLNSLTTALGRNVFDGTSIWSPVLGTDVVMSINPSTLSGTPYTLSANASSDPYQIGFDGQYLYISADGGGILVFDTLALTGVLVGSAATTHCYYSFNLGLVLVSDSSGTIYTMPAGGGSLTAVADASTVTGEADTGIWGFGDGPSGSIWATAIVDGPDTHIYFLTEVMATFSQVMVV